ncbi:MAG: hypothetical protein J5726_10535, partial [Treponema sp.]|nr:hypothetical protein [Treponema sp.]
QYCQFIEIVEHNYNKLFPKKSFKKAIEIAMEQGIAIGMQQGARQKALEVAKSLYSNGASVELIAKSLGMTVEQVEEIIEE